MESKCLHVVAFILILHTCLSVKTPDYKGTEFIVAFMENAETSASLEIFLTTSHNHAVNVHVSSPRFSSKILPMSFKLNSGGMKQIQLESSFAMSGTGKDSKAILITSDEEIIIYGANVYQYTTDAFLSLPTDILSNEYFIATYQHNFNWPNEMVIIGISDSTVIDITLSDAIDSESVTWQGVIYHRGDTFQINVGRFDTVQIQSHGDLTGSYIKSNNPIGVMSGVKCVQIGTGACDHIVEMMMPLSTWGKQFATVPIPGRAVGDVFRIIASEDNTKIKIKGGYTFNSTITKAGTFTEHVIPSTSYCYMEADKAIMVVQYVQGQSGNDFGDPSMLLVQPIGGYSSSFSFTTLTRSVGSFQNYFAFLVRRKYKDGLRLDGVLINTTFHNIAGSDFVGGYISITEGAHTIRHDSPIALFAGYLYGTADYESYAFPIGSRLAPINLACNPTKTTVGDGLDNDCDSLIDEEICTAANNGMDDDGDGLVNEDCAMTYIVVDECDPNPCQNNASCNGTVGSFECLCRDFYTGFLCQTGMQLKIDGEKIDNKSHYFKCFKSLRTLLAAVPDLKPFWEFTFIPIDLCLVKEVDIIFLLDASLSTSAEDLEMQRNFVKEFVKQITISTERFRISVIKYSDVPLVEIPFNSSLSKDEILSMVTNVQLMNRSTNVGAALKTAHKILVQRTSARQYVYLFTDGLLSDINEAKAEASDLQKHLKRTRFENSLLQISFRDNVRHKTLLDVADAAGIESSNIFTLHNMDAFHNVLPRMISPECEACMTTTSSDIVFMIGSHGNMTGEIFQKQLDIFQMIMKEIESKYQLGPEALQIGGIVFSFDVHYSLNLNATNKFSQVKRFLLSVRQDSVMIEANISNAVMYMEYSMFSEERGHRASARKFVIYFVSDVVSPTIFDSLKQTGFTIITIGINENLQDEVVTDIATSASHAFFNDSDFSNDTVKLIIKEFEYTSCTDRIKSSL